MSVFGAIGETGLNEILVRRLTTPGGTLAPGVAPELFPTLTLENDRPEWGYLKSEQLASLTRRHGGVAGEHYQLFLSNPSRESLMVITRITNISTSDLVIGYGALPGFTIGETIGFAVNRDMRFGATNTAVGVSGTTSLVPTFLRQFGRVSSGQSFDEPLILPPTNAFGLIVFNATVNVTTNCNVHFRLRRAEPGELR